MRIRVILRRALQRDSGRTALDEQRDHALVAYRGIRRMLYKKELVPGQKIVCGEIAERLKMSPTPIIQALKWLEIQGLVRHGINRGYFLEPISLKELEEIYGLRELLEPSLIPVTVKKIDQEGKKRLKKALDEHFSAVREFYLKERLFKNMEFHLTLASLSGNQTQVRLLRNVFDLLFLKYGGNVTHGSSLESVDKEHREIYEGVVTGNPKAAQKVLKKHISNVKRQVLEIFRRMLEERDVPLP